MFEALPTPLELEKSLLLLVGVVAPALKDESPVLERRLSSKIPSVEVEIGLILKSRMFSSEGVAKPGVSKLNSSKTTNPLKASLRLGEKRFACEGDAISDKAELIGAVRGEERGEVSGDIRGDSTLCGEKVASNMEPLLRRFMGLFMLAPSKFEDPLLLLFKESKEFMEAGAGQEPLRIMLGTIIPLPSSRLESMSEVVLLKSF